MLQPSVRLIPSLIAEHCNGCMECVANCGNNAMFGRVVDRTTVVLTLARIERAELRNALKARFVPRAVFRGMRNHGRLSDMVFSVFIDNEKCKGCGDCVAACNQLHALELVPVQDMWLETLHFDLFKNLPRYSKSTKAA
jgi:Fe-S-cluster-containing dehydrogenase component